MEGSWCVETGGADLSILLGPIGRGPDCNDGWWFMVEETEEGRWLSGSLRIFDGERGIRVHNPQSVLFPGHPLNRSNCTLGRTSQNLLWKIQICYVHRGSAYTMIYITQKDEREKGNSIPIYRRDRPGASEYIDHREKRGRIIERVEERGKS